MQSDSTISQRKDDKHRDGQVHRHEHKARPQIIYEPAPASHPTQEDGNLLGGVLGGTTGSSDLSDGGLGIVGAVMGGSLGAPGGLLGGGKASSLLGL